MTIDTCRTRMNSLLQEAERRVEEQMDYQEEEEHSFSANRKEDTKDEPKKAATLLGRRGPGRTGR